MIEFPDKNIWTGRFDDEDGDLGLRLHQKIRLKNFAGIQPQTENSFAVLGFCSDEGVKRNKGRIGAANAPDEIRKACANLPFHSTNSNQVFDFGNIKLNGSDLESARNEQVQCVSELIENQFFPIILGGGHETALGDFLALSKHYKNIGIINIDAHFDLRIPVEKSSSGTPFFEMAQFCRENNREFHYLCAGIQKTGNTQALFERANELNVKTILADEIQIDLNQTLREIKDFAKQFDAVYLSLDLDVLDAAFAPGVSAPCVNGLNPFQVKSIIRQVKKSGRLKLFDVVELNPEFDSDNRTAKLAAHFLQEFVN